MPTLTKQIQDIIAFFNLWGARVDGKYEVHVAFTVSKSDLLDGLVPDYDQYHVGLGPSSSSGEWRRALGLVSRASERVLWETERQAVQLVKDNFHKSAFFFVSALGRDAVPVVRRGRPARPTAARVGGESAPWMSPGQDASQALPGAGPASSDDDLPWNLQKLVALGADGTRTPKPRNVLLPLLWLLAQGQ